MLGRTASEDLRHPETGKVMVKRGQIITEDHCVVVEEAGLETAKIRSVMTCESVDGVCASCYGRDLARGTQAGPVRLLRTSLRR